MVRHRLLNSIHQERMQSQSFVLLFMHTHPCHCSKQRADVSTDDLQELISDTNFISINVMPALKTEHFYTVLWFAEQSRRKCELKIPSDWHTYDSIQVMRYRNFPKMYV